MTGLAGGRGVMMQGRGGDGRAERTAEGRGVGRRGVGVQVLQVQWRVRPVSVQCVLEIHWPARTLHNGLLVIMLAIIMIWLTRRGR